MKSSKQIADYVFKARDEHNQKKRKNIIMIKRISAFGTLGCTVAAVLVCSFNLLPMLEKNTVEVIPPSEQYQYTAYHSDSELQTSPSSKTTHTLVSQKTDTSNEQIPTESMPAIVTKPLITAPMQNLTSVTMPVTTNPVANSKPSVTVTASVSKPVVTKASQTTKKTTKKTPHKTTAKSTVNTKPSYINTSEIATDAIPVTQTKAFTTEYIPTTQVTYLTGYITDFVTDQPDVTSTYTNDIPPNATVLPPGVNRPNNNNREILQNVSTLILPNGHRFSSLGYTVEQSMISNFIYNYNTITVDESSNQKYNIDINIYRIVNKDSDIYIAAKSAYGNTFFVYKLSE